MKSKEVFFELSLNVQKCNVFGEAFFLPTREFRLIYLLDRIDHVHVITFLINLGARTNYLFTAPVYQTQ